MIDRVTWPLWQCLESHVLAMLIQYQWQEHGLTLDIMSDLFGEVEDIEEIDRLMRQAPSKSRGTGG